MDASQLDISEFKVVDLKTRGAYGEKTVRFQMDSSGNCSVCFLSPALAEETRGFPCINVMFNSDGRFAMRFSMSGKPSVGKHRNIAHGSVLYRELLSRGYRFEGRHSLKVVQTVRQGGYIYEIFEQGNEIRPGEKIIGK